MEHAIELCLKERCACTDVTGFPDENEDEWIATSPEGTSDVGRKAEAENDESAGKQQGSRRRKKKGSVLFRLRNPDNKQV